MEAKATTTGFECDICLESCGSKLNLETHVKSHVKKTKLEVRAEQSQGQAVTDQFKCGLCAENCSNQTDLSLHLQQHTGRKILVCDHCNFQSPEKLKMKIHSTIHKGVTATASSPNRRSLYKCRKCYVAFKTKEKLHAHDSKMHMPTYQCSVCGYKFSGNSSLQKHIKSICSSPKHERMSESILYDCTMCLKQFSRLKDLRNHLTEHTSIYSKICSICSEICVSQKVLERHTANNHPKN